jgi:FHA domain-containing protein
MPFLQFFSGARDQEIVELNAAGGTVIGNNPEAQVQCSDAGVMANHCQVYQGDGKWWLRDGGSGSTVMQMRRIGPNNPPEIVPLTPGEVFIVGQTYIKFWQDKPAGGGGGADPAALEAAQAETAKAQEELAALKTEHETLKASGADAGVALETAQGELAKTQGELESLRADLATAKSEQETTAGELEAAKAETEAAKAEVEGAKAEAEAAKTEAAAEIQSAKDEASKLAEEAAEAARSERAEIEEALAASRGALEGIRAELETAPSDPLAAAADSDLQAILDSLGLDDALRRRLATAIRAETDREVLRRVQGPVVPLRGLRVPGLDVDLEGALRRVRARNEQLARVRELGLDSLEESELERLLELARS